MLKFGTLHHELKQLSAKEGNQVDQYRLMKIFRESLPSNLRIALAAKDNAEHIDTLIDHFEGVIRTSERELWLQAKTTPLPAPPPRDNYREQPREE